MLPSAVKPEGARRYTVKEWEDQKEEIARLYETGTLENVVIRMREDHGFEATPKQYKDRIKKWGLKKNIQPEEMEVMIRKQKEREIEQRKETAFMLRGRPVDQAKIDRYIRDHDIDEDVVMGGDASPAATPADITYYTPADTGAAMSPEASIQDESPKQTLNASAEAFVPGPSQSQPIFSSSFQYTDGGYSSAPSNRPLGRPGLPAVYSSGNVSGKPNAPPPLPPSGMQAFGGGASQNYAFQYSNCTGRRKALLIGINYFGQRGQLRGCINDVKNLSLFLHENFGYKRDDMVILTDDQQNAMSQPTKQNILRAMHWLVKNARPNDSLFFHYSGHGGQTKDLDSDEEDGYDEVIYPVDFRQVGHIGDDEMHRIMVQPLQAGVRLTAIFDSCHSGTALDLPYIYSTQGILKEPNLAKEASYSLLGAYAKYSQGDLGGVANNSMGFFKKATGGGDAYNRVIATKTSSADVVMWSTSRDDWTSSDATIAAQATGAMSWAFITAMKKNPDQSFVQLLNSIRDELATKYTQKPQLSCNHPLNTNLRFVM